jgi:signal transduction histidine kinase
MASDGAGISGATPGPVSDCYERCAEFIRENQNAIMASCERRLEELYGPAAGGSGFCEQLMAEASLILTDVIESVLANDVRIDCRPTPAWAINLAQTDSSLSPPDWLRAGAAFFSAAVCSLAGYVGDDPELLPGFKIAVLALNENISRRIGDATAVYTELLLNRIHRTQLDERRRIARDLHDRLGERLSVGLRQLDLQEIAGPKDRISEAMIAREMLTEAMRRLRLVTSDLREEPVTSLENALIHYLDSVAVDAEVRLRVSGDEAWASPAVFDEVFLIIREAVRNTLAHGDPRLVLIDVDMAPHELRALVKDDGRGFVPDPCVSGSGLASMRERAALMGGRLAISSTPGGGTSVELIVSLPGHRGE